MDNTENIDNFENKEVNAEASKFCYRCYAILDSNKSCTNVDCKIYGIPQE